MHATANRACLTILIAALMSARCGGDPMARRQRHLERADEYFKQGQFSEAVVEYRNAIQISETFGEARAKLALSYERLGDYQKAFAERIRAADLLPQDVDLQLSAGGYLLAAGRFDEARSRAQNVLKLESENVRAQILLGNSLAGLREFDQAISEIERAIQLDPERAATYVNLGMLESSQGQRDAAEAALKKAVAIDPKWIPARLALANHYWSTSRKKEAEETLRAALSLNPKDALANQAMTLFLIGNERVAEAEPFVRATAETGSAPMALADYYLANRRPADAIAELVRLRGDERLRDQATRRLARAYGLQKDWANVHKTVDELIGRSPTDPEMLLIKGQALVAQGQREAALEPLKRAAQVEGTSAVMKFALGQALSAAGATDDARKAYAQAVELNPRMTHAQVALARLDLMSGQTDEAARRAREALRTEPESVEGRLILARALVARHELEAADEVLRQLLKARPDSAQVHVQRGTFFVAKRDAVSARQSFERALELDKRSVEAIGGLVALDASSGELDRATSRINAALKDQGERPELLLIAASTQAGARQFDTAVSMLQRAIQLNPGLLPAYLLLGQVYVTQGKIDQAKRELEIAAARQTKPVAAVTMLGMIAEMQGDTKLARKHFERVLDLEPGSPIAANNLAWMYAEEGSNLDVALQLAQTAVKKMPRMATAHDTLGWVYYKKQLPDRAVAALTDTIGLDPQNPTYHYHLALALRQAGDPARARASLDRALQLNPAFPQASDARRTLAELAAETQSAR
jgi:tetratricopeptide (TPR) repeat protein